MFQSRFDELRHNQERVYVFDLEKSGIGKEDLIVKIAIFTGDLEVEFFSDKELTKLVFNNGFHHMGDSMYKFSQLHRTQDNITKFLYLRVKSANVSTTFVVNIQMKIENIIRLAG